MEGAIEWVQSNGQTIGAIAFWWFIAYVIVKIFHAISDWWHGEDPEEEKAVEERPIMKVLEFPLKAIAFLITAAIMISVVLFMLALFGAALA